MYTETRDRRPHAIELKFLVTPDIAGAIRAWARDALLPDPHGDGPFSDRYTTTTLYTDTPEQDVYRRLGSYGRSKFRIRRYGAADVVFLERKLRTSSLLSKRRTMLPLDDLSILDTSTAAVDDWPGRWFATRLAMRQLGPVCQVTYERTARVMSTPYGLARLTVDDALEAQPSNGWRFAPPAYRPALVDRQIVELKYLVAMPAPFKAMLATFGLEPARVSKYRLSIDALGLAPAPAVAAGSMEVA